MPAIALILGHPPAESSGGDTISLVLDALRKAKGNESKAAKILGFQVRIDGTSGSWYRPIVFAVPRSS